MTFENRCETCAIYKKAMESSLGNTTVFCNKKRAWVQEMCFCAGWEGEQ